MPHREKTTPPFSSRLIRLSKQLGSLFYTAQQDPYKCVDDTHTSPFVIEEEDENQPYRDDDDAMSEITQITFNTLHYPDEQSTHSEETKQYPWRGIPSTSQNSLKTCDGTHSTISEAAQTITSPSPYKHPATIFAKPKTPTSYLRHDLSGQKTSPYQNPVLSTEELSIRLHPNVRGTAARTDTKAPHNADVAKKLLNNPPRLTSLWNTSKTRRTQNPMDTTLPCLTSPRNRKAYAGMPLDSAMSLETDIPQQTSWSSRLCKKLSPF